MKKPGRFSQSPVCSPLFLTNKKDFVSSVHWPHLTAEKPAAFRNFITLHSIPEQPMLAGTSGDHFEFPACWVLGISKD